MSIERPSIDNPENLEKTAENKLFEVKKNIKGVDVTVNVGREGEPMSGSLDLEKKTIELNVTLEGIKNGLNALANGLFEEPEEGKTKLGEWAEKIEASREERRRKSDGETIKKYAEQESMTEKEVIEDILSEFENKK